MQPTELFFIFTQPLDSAHALYMVTGSVAGIAYGEPRLTNDIDIVITIDHELAGRLENLFSPGEFYCPPREIIEIESRRPHRGHFNIIHHESGLKADMFVAGDDALQHWGLFHRHNIDFSDGKSIWIAPLEYVILKKLEYYREGQSEKHLVDIRGMLAISGENLDRSFFEEQLNRLNLHSEWGRVKCHE